MNLRTLAADLQNPSTRTGTAWWACLVIALYDTARYHMNPANGGILLALAGLDLASRYLKQPPPPLPPPPPAVPTAVPA